MRLCYNMPSAAMLTRRRAICILTASLFNTTSQVDVFLKDCYVVITQ